MIIIFIQYNLSFSNFNFVSVPSLVLRSSMLIYRISVGIGQIIVSDTTHVLTIYNTTKLKPTVDCNMPKFKLKQGEFENY